MPSRSSISALMLLACLLSTSPASAQDPNRPQPSPDAVGEQLDRLNRTLSRIAELLERQIEGQRLELGLQRVELANRRVGALESALTQARSERTRVAEEQARLRSFLDSLADQIDRGDSSSLHALEAESRQVGARLETLEPRGQELDQRILELGNELTRRRRELEALEDRLDRALEGL